MKFYDQQPPTMMDRFCSAWRWAWWGISLGFVACLILLDSGYRPESIKLGFYLLAFLVGFIGIVPSLLLEIARRYRQIRKLKWS